MFLAGIAAPIDGTLVFCLAGTRLRSLDLARIAMVRSANAIDRFRARSGWRHRCTDQRQSDPDLRSGDSRSAVGKTLFRCTPMARRDAVRRDRTLIVVPWVVRNIAVFGRLYPVRSNAPFELFQGNNPKDCIR